MDDDADAKQRARRGTRDDIDVSENAFDDAQDREPSLHRVHAKYRHLRELKRQREAETAARAAVADMFEG